MAKRVITRPPNYLQATRVTDIYSVSNCMSEAFADYINYWAHNGYWFFDSPQIIRGVARANAIDLTGTTLLFYEIYEQEFDADERRWEPFEQDPSFATRVVPPAQKTLEGFDVVTFSGGMNPECSPLSCNAVAERIETNAHCLLPSVERARASLEAGAFQNAEPGPYRIFAVHSTTWA